MQPGGVAGQADRFVQAQARLARDPAFQFDFLGLPPHPRPAPLPPWLLHLLKAAGPAAPYVFWGVLAFGVGFLLFLVGRALLRERGGRVRSAKVLDGPGLAPSRARVHAILAEAERLAGEGRFGEAVRVLLHRTLDDIADRRPGLIAPAQTAREIAALEALSPAVREPLARIAAGVERFLFAGHPLDRSAFESCRAEYDRFLAAAGRG